MNKGGVAIIKMIIFLIGSLIIGALVIFALPNMVRVLMNNAEEQIIAKDIGLTIMTVSASPNNIIYKYDKNTEKYEIRITQNEVQVNSGAGSGKYKYIPMLGVIVDDALIQKALMIPLTLKNGKLSFEDDKVSFSDVCSNIPSNFGKDKIKVKIDVPSGESSQSKQKIEEISAFMKMYSTQANSKIEFVDSNEDFILSLQTGSSFEVKYYEDLADQTKSWYHKIACYTSSTMNADEKTKAALGTFVFNPSSEESMTIILGDTNKFIDALKNDATLSVKLSREIYNSIGLGMSD